MSHGLKNPKSAKELLDMYYLQLRCNLLEAAASFDRIQKADGFAEEVKNDSRYQNLRKSLEILASSSKTRACDFLNLFSEDEK